MTKAIATVLGRRAFLPVERSLFDTVHRFERGGPNEVIAIDILGPDNVGKRQKLTTYGSATTLATPGGTFALATAKSNNSREAPGEGRSGSRRSQALSA